MRYLFVAKVKYTKQLDNGAFKRVSEPFILEAMTFGHAEQRIFEQLDHIRGEIILDDLKRIKFDDMFFGYVPKEEVPLFVQAKISVHAYTEDSDSPKSTSYKYLIRVKDFSEAEGYLNELIDAIGMDVTKVETQSITKTTFVDYFPMSETESAKWTTEQPDADDMMIAITTPDGKTVETDMKTFTQTVKGMNSEIKNRMESVSESED
jgi:hypothetical protein